ncbi:MAG: helix-turn-helix domain-containing protein [Alphaproteobacteria bacterium]|nr:helix-turn-helix domain-containing protein [Alphaproteobacteria bacterium]
MDQIARTPEQIGVAVRRQRRRLGLTQTEVGAPVRLRQATISALENGARGAQLGTLCDILGALDLELVLRVRTRGPAIEDIF